MHPPVSWQKHQFKNSDQQNPIYITDVHPARVVLGVIYHENCLKNDMIFFMISISGYERVRALYFPLASILIKLDHKSINQIAVADSGILKKGLFFIGASKTN
jgi:hypothetical protein